MSEERCPWKIHWGVGQESTTQCDNFAHVFNVDVTTLPNGHLVNYVGDPSHSGPSGVMPGQRITWEAGDRREYVGDWPGECDKLPGCTLHLGHHGRCAP